MLHGFLWFTGVSPTPAGTSPMYQLWSGIVPALAILSLAGTAIRSLYRWLKAQECYVEECHRHGKYRDEGMRACWEHHSNPDLTPRGMPAGKLPGPR